MLKVEMILALEKASLKKALLSARFFPLVCTEFFLIPVLIKHNNRTAFSLNKRNLMDHRVGVEEEIWHMYFIKKLPLTRY